MAGISKRRGGNLPTSVRSKTSTSSTGKHKIDKQSIYQGINVGTTKKSEKVKNSSDGGGVSNSESGYNYHNVRHGSSDKLRLHLRTSDGNQIEKKHKQHRSQRRVFDPTVLARGLSGRVLGAKIPELKPLQPEEIKKDLRLMEAYHNACVTYAQKYFIFQNQALVSQGYYDGFNHEGNNSIDSSSKKLKTGQGLNNSSSGVQTKVNNSQTSPVAAVATPLPVRIDPEEEKRLAILRKKISYSESQREVLETQYLSLRASYVHQNQKLKHLHMTMDAQLSFLRGVVHSRAKYLALRRLRVGVARDVLACLEYRKGPDDDPKQLEKLLSYWNNLEKELKNAEKECMAVDSPNKILLEENMEDDAENKRKIDELIWENQYIPKTPYDVLLYVSCLGYAPDKFIGSSLSSILGSHPKSVQFVPSNLPDEDTNDEEEVKSLLKEMQMLDDEIELEQQLNLKLHHDIYTRHKRSDEMCAFMSLLRSETDALLNRHNIILETPEAKDRAKILYLNSLAEKEKEATTTPPAPMDTVAQSTLRDGEEADNEQASSEEEDDDEEEDSMLMTQQEDDPTSAASNKDGTNDDDESSQDDNHDDSMLTPTQSRLSSGEEEGEDEEYSIEEGEIQGDEQEEEGEIVEEGDNPVKEIIVRHDDDPASKEEDTMNEEEDDDDEGEIVEDEGNDQKVNRIICDI